VGVDEVEGVLGALGVESLDFGVSFDSAGLVSLEDSDVDSDEDSDPLPA
jgi:hypothetical protein